MPRLPLAAWLVALWIGSFPAWAADLPNTLETKYSTIRYTQDGEITAFLWRISGHRLGFEEGSVLASNRVDEITDKVQSLLELYPTSFHMEILLFPKYEGKGSPGFYSHRNKDITLFVDRVTDGMLAHEIAHAVISSSFEVPPPEKAQEILAQYVDEHLWSEL